MSAVSAPSLSTSSSCQTHGAVGDAGVQELLALGHEAELGVVAHQPGLGLDDEVAGESLGVLDAGTDDIRAQTRAAVAGVDHEAAEAGPVLGGEDAGAADERLAVEGEDVAGVGVRVLVVNLVVGGQCCSATKTSTRSLYSWWTSNGVISTSDLNVIIFRLNSSCSAVGEVAVRPLKGALLARAVQHDREQEGDRPDQQADEQLARD